MDEKRQKRALSYTSEEDGLEIKIRERNEVIIFDITGDLRRSEVTATTLHQCLKDQLERGKRKLLLNFEKVDFVDSFGVGEMLASYISTQNVGGKIKLQKIRPKIRILLEITMIINLFKVYEDEEAAIMDFSD